MDSENGVWMGFRTSLDFSRAGNATWTFWKSLVFSVDIWRQSGVSPNRARIGLRFPVFPGIETVIPENETIIHAIPVIFTSVRQRRYLGVFGRAISDPDRYSVSATRKNIVFPQRSGRPDPHVNEGNPLFGVTPGRVAGNRRWYPSCTKRGGGWGRSKRGSISFMIRTQFGINYANEFIRQATLTGVQKSDLKCKEKI